MNNNRLPSTVHSTGEVHTRVSNRIIGFSDGVFAISITLLVLTINVPSNLTSSEEVSGFLRQALPQLVVYAAAFMVIGTFWLRHYRMFGLCRAVDARVLVLNLVFLAFVSLLPFPSDLIDFDDQSPSAVIAFCAVGSAATLCEFALWRHLHGVTQIYCCPTYRKDLSWHKGSGGPGCLVCSSYASYSGL